MAMLAKGEHSAVLSSLTSETRRSIVALLALFALVILPEGLRGAARPYWSDELATVHVVSAPTWGGMLHLSRTVDLNPPLFYAMERLSFRVLGPHEFAGRLPSVLCFAVAVGCIFLFLRRRIPVTYAAVGALLPLCNAEVSYYATEARPYALLLGSLSLAVLAYDSIVLNRRPNLARVVLLLAASSLVLAHMFGLIALSALLAAEVVRSWRRRQVDWLTWGPLLLPLACCLTYLPLLAQGSSSSGGHVLVYRAHDRVSLARCFGVYHDFLFLPVEGLLKLMAIVLLALPHWPPARRWTSRLQIAEWTALLILLCTPILLAVVFYLRAPTGGYYPRYSIAVVLPACLLLAIFLSWKAQGNHVVGTILLAGALLFFCVHSGDVLTFARTIPEHGLLRAPTGLSSTGGVSGLYPDLPLIMGDPIVYMEAAARLEPSDFRRLFYLTDQEEALRLGQSNAGESVADMAAAFQLHGQVVPYRPFLRQHQRFLLLCPPQHPEWILMAMEEKKAGMRLLGTYRYAGEDLNLWLVDLNRP